MKSVLTVVQLLQLAMECRGVMSMREIYLRAEVEFRNHGKTVPAKFDSEIRQTLQAHCESSKQYGGRGSLFTHHSRGLWSCKYRRSDLLELL